MHTTCFGCENVPKDHVCLFNVCSKTKGSCKTYTDTCHTSDKGKGRGSSSLASPAPRSQASKKGSSTSPPQQQQKKHKVSLYYTKYKPSSSTAAAVDEEQETLTPESPLTPDTCNNNNQPAFLTELEKHTSTGFKEDLQGTVEDGTSAAVMFPMEIPAGFPGDVTLSPGPRPGLLICSPVERSCSELYSGKTVSEKRDSSDLEVRVQKC